MDNILQNNYGLPVASNVVGTHTRNMYILQVKPNNSEGPLEAEGIPLNMLLSEQDIENEQYLISVLQSKPLQLFIDPQGQFASNTNSQFYELPITEPQRSTDFVNSLQIVNNLNDLTSDSFKREADHPGELIPDIPDIALVDTATKTRNSERVKRDVPKSTNNQKSVVQRFVHIKDTVAPPRAVAVLPGALQLRRGVVSPRRPLPARVSFGPVEGINQLVSPTDVENLVAEATKSNLPLFLLKTDQETIHIDVSDKDKANWLSLLPLEQSSANVWLYQDGGALCCVAPRGLPARAPLVLGYSREYALDHGLPDMDAISVDEEVSATPRQWRCGACARSAPTAALLQKHMLLHHAEEKQRKQQRYRCRHCTRTFSRMFTLRRHISQHCTKKVKEEIVEKPPEPAPELSVPKPADMPELTLTSTQDDSRLPSDESLHSSLLASNLDFSTNLFDTDRMPNLDISGSSKSDEFNPYSLGLKDDIGLVNGSIDFEIEAESCDRNEEAKAENEESMFLTCRYCNQTVVKGKQRQHVRNCEGRKFECECGKSFLYKEKLALHIRFDHADAAADGKQTPGDKKKSEDLQYKCETCKHTFKRRGMLVNHLWRVHRDAAMSVPLERRVRHYPCGACPKLYRSAAKRERHVGAHHPGLAAGNRRPAVIEGAKRACSPAACPACPRQYATRAKLLQHVRAIHPPLAPPVQKRTAKRK